MNLIIFIFKNRNALTEKLTTWLIDKVRQRERYLRQPSLKRWHNQEILKNRIYCGRNMNWKSYNPWKPLAHETYQIRQNNWKEKGPRINGNVLHYPEGNLFLTLIFIANCKIIVCTPMVQILGNNKIIKLQKEKENLIKYFTTICACMNQLAYTWYHYNNWQ